MTCREAGPAPLVSVTMVVYRPHPRYFREAVESIVSAPRITSLDGDCSVEARP
jgi:hypothetical protein